MSQGLNQLYRIGLVCLVGLWLAALIPGVVDDYRVYKQPALASRLASEPANPVIKLAPLALADLYLMGSPPKAMPATKPVETELLETRLDLTLRGVFASQGPLLGGAVIETGAAEPGFFQIGDVIADDITLAAVDEQGIIIDRNGIREKLSFSQRELAHFSRLQNRDFIKAPITGAVALVEQAIGPGASPPSLEDRLIVLRRKYHRKTQ